jgi:uncharacterized protein (TIGR03067 family)
MRTFNILGLFCVTWLLVAANADANKKDLDAMQGDWSGEKFVKDGFALTDDDAQSYFRTMKGDTYTMNRFRKKAGSGKIKLDASKSPKQIDFIPDVPKGKEIVLEGIYKFEEGKLVMCYAGPKGKRPTMFESKMGSGVTLTVWVREKK